MKKTALIICFSTLTLGAGIASDNIVTEKREVAPFSSLALNGVGTVHIRQGEPSVRVITDKKLLKHYKTTVKDGKLFIGLKCGPQLTAWRSLKYLKKTVVEISVPDLQSIELNGAGKIITDPFDFGDLKLKVTGAGTLELQGTATNLDVISTGKTKIQARELKTENAVIGMTGAGTAEFTALETLDISLTGAGKITYWGNPEVNQKISGAGKIITGE